MIYSLWDDSASRQQPRLNTTIIRNRGLARLDSGRLKDLLLPTRLTEPT